MRLSQSPPISHHLFILVMCTVVPFILLGIFLIRDAADRRWTQANLEAVHQVHAITVATDREIAESIAALQAVALSPNFDHVDAAGLRRELVALTQLHPQWGNAVATAPDGQQVANTLKEPGEALPKATFTADDDFGRILKTRTPAILAVRVGAVVKEPMVPVVVPVVREGEARFLIGASLPIRMLSEQLAYGFGSSPAIISIVGRDNKIIARSRDRERWVGKTVPDWFLEAARNSDAGVTSGPGLDGQIYIVAFEHSPATGWIMTYGVPRSTIEAPIARSLYLLSALSLVSVIASLLIAFIFAARVRRGFRSLQNAFRRVMVGESAGELAILPLRELTDLWMSLTRIGAEVASGRARYKSLVDSLPGALVSYNLTGKGLHQTLYVSEGCRTLLEMPPETAQENIFGYHWSLCAEEELPPQRSVKFDRLRETGHFEGEWRVILPDGQLRWIHESARRIERADDFLLVEGYLRDVTAEHDAKIALHEQEMELSRIIAAVDMAGDGIAVLAAGDTVLYLNQALRRLLRGEADPRGRPARETGFFRYFLGSLSDSDDPSGEGIERSWDDGDKELLLNFRIRHLPGGGSVVIVSDQTERKRREQERLDVELRLARSHKMEALGQLAGGIAHDFNNLLGAILGFAALIADDAAAGTPPGRYAEKISIAGKRAQGLISQILTFSGGGDGARGPVLLEEVAKETLSILQATIPATTHLSLHCAVPHAVVEGRSGHLAQVLTNLCINANDALGGRLGDVTVELAEADLNDRAWQALTSDQPRAGRTVIDEWQDEAGLRWRAYGQLDPTRRHFSLIVSDTGSGISDRTFERIFDAFFTTKGTGRGTGLGLAVVQGIVLNHEGAILVSTGLGRGTRFEIILPASERTAPTEAALVKPAQNPIRRGRILIVDDNQYFCDMLMTYLERQGHEVAACSGVAAALELLTENAGFWQVMISDQTMPDGLGQALIAQAAKIAPAMSSILCTGHADGVSEETAKAAGAKALLMKPLDLPRLIALIDELLAAEAETP